MIEWWGLIIVFIIGLFWGYNGGYYYAYSKSTKFLSKAGINSVKGGVRMLINGQRKQSRKMIKEKTK